VKFLHKLKDYLLALGIPGVFAIAFLDSAAVPMAGGPDAVVLFLSWQKPSQVLLIVLAAAVGSALGSVVLYYIGRAGGELALSRFEPSRRVWVKEKMDRNAFWAVIVAVMAPPPFPTKPVVMAAGVFNMPLGKFLTGVLIGRLIRYGLEGYAGARFGDQAARILKAQYPIIFLVLIGCLLLFVLVRRVRRPGGDKLDVHVSPPHE
jgi:membrane protein YqaA with SNARE-associated domain